MLSAFAAPTLRARARHAAATQLNPSPWAAVSFGRTVYRYEGIEPLLATLAEKVIAPAEGKVQALAERRRMIEAELTKPQ
jgi:hypothetical protein